MDIVHKSNGTAYRKSLLERDMLYSTQVLEFHQALLALLRPL